MTEGGKFKRVFKFFRQNEEISGIAQLIEGVWFALLVEQGKLIFVMGDRKIGLDKIKSCQNSIEAENRRRFQLQLTSDEGMDFSYKRKISRSERFVDPTLDYSDEQDADLLLWILDVVQDKNVQDGYLKQWV